MIQVKYADAPFCLDTDQVNRWIEENCSLGDTHITTPERPWPGVNLVGASYPFRHPVRPRLRVGTFFYPTGASRWGEYHGLVDQNSYKAMVNAAYAGSRANANKFAIFDDVQNWGFSTPMYMLPPRPLANFTGSSSLWLVTLVDERFYFHWRSTGILSIDSDTTWSDLFTSLGSSLSIDLTPDDIDEVYGQPEPDSDLNAIMENPALLLDAVAANVGQVVVRRYSGKFVTMNFDTSVEQATANWGLLNTSLAGGDLFQILNPPFAQFAPSYGTPNANIAALLPSQFVVTFPKWNKNQFYLGDNSEHLRGPINGTDVYASTVNLSDLPTYGAFAGVNGMKVFHDTAKAIISDDPDTPDNKDALDILAQEIAFDWCNYQSNPTDITFPGLVPWIPEGLDDVQIAICAKKESEYSPEDLDKLRKGQGNEVSGFKAQTRVMRKPFNFDIEEYCHNLNTTPGAFIQVGLWARITDRDDTPNDDGHFPCAWTEVTPDGVGGWDDFEDGIEGTFDENPAFEAEDKPPPLNEVFWLSIGKSGEYVFTLSGGGPTYLRIDTAGTMNSGTVMTPDGTGGFTATDVTDQTVYSYTGAELTEGKVYEGWKHGDGYYVRLAKFTATCNPDHTITITEE